MAIKKTLYVVGKNIENKTEVVVWLLCKGLVQLQIDYGINSCLHGSRGMYRSWERHCGEMSVLYYRKSNNDCVCLMQRKKAGERIDQALQNQERQQSC